MLKAAGWKDSVSGCQLYLLLLQRQACCCRSATMLGIRHFCAGRQGGKYLKEKDNSERKAQWAALTKMLAWKRKEGDNKMKKKMKNRKAQWRRK